MAAHGEDLPVETRVEMVRQLAEALDHAHRRHLYHRALAARCVYVEMDGRYPRLRICDWQVAARPGARLIGTTPALASSGPGVASLAAHIERSAGPYLAPEFGSPDCDADPARRVRPRRAQLPDPHRPAARGQPRTQLASGWPASAR